jgi:hypothetical protein
MSDGKATIGALNDLHGLVATELARKIRNGEATAADFAVAAKFLKDNHIEALPSPGSPLASLVDSLPFPAVGIEH